MNNRILIIGAGGIGANLVMALSPVKDIIVADGDKYEEHNSARQPFTSIGRNKAVCLKRLFNKGAKDIIAYNKMIDGDEEFKNIETIICAVDSNTGRIAAKELSLKFDCPLIVAANEEWNPMSWLFFPDYIGSEWDPFIYDKIDQAKEEERSCTGAIQLRTDPQTPSANHVAAGHALTILRSLEQSKKKENMLANVKSIPWPQYTQFKSLENER